MGGMLRVFHGPFEALETAFSAHVGELLPAPGGSPVLVVAPSRILADRLERLLAVEKGLSLIGVHFHTFHSLAATVVEEDGVGEGVLISDPSFHDAVVDQVLDETPALGIARTLRSRALAAAVRSSLRDLVDAGVDPHFVADNFGDELLPEASQRERLIELLSLLAGYRRKLAHLNILPTTAVTERAAQLAPRSAWLAQFAKVLYYGFYDLTGLQADVFEAVTSSRPSRFYFPYRKGHPAYRFADEFFEVKLASRGPIALPRSPQAASALGGAVDALFDPSAAQTKVDPNRVRVVSASGARDEAWAAAKECARFLREGTPGSEIAVIARTLEPYRVALTEAFAAEGLPLEVSGGEPILRHPLAKASLDLLTLRRRDFPASMVSDLTASPYFVSQSRGRVALWRRLISALGVRAGWLQWQGKLEPRAGGPVELYPHRVREGLPGLAVAVEDVRSLWDFLDGVRESLGGPAAAWSRRAETARALIAAHLGFPADASSAERDAQQAVEGALDELAVFDRLGRECTWEEFLDAFEMKLSSAARPLATGGRGIRALDAMDARGHRFDAVVLIGLKEKLFPRPIAEDPILRDEARSALKHPGGHWIARKTAGHEEERLLFALTVDSARKRLSLIYPRSDENGRPEVPSIYLRELCRAAGLPPPGAADAWRVPRPPAERLAELAAIERTPAEFALLCALRGVEPPRVLETAGVPAGALQDGLRLIAQLNAPGPAGARDGLVPAPTAEIGVWKSSGLSPTALDQYETCPFQFFASRVLGLGEHEEGSERSELSSVVRGSVYHAVLERFYRTLATADPTVHLEAVIQEIFRENDWRVLGLYPLLWEAARAEMSGHLRSFVVWDIARLRAANLRPRSHETPLRGEPEGGAPGGIPWRGVADRIDSDEVGRRFRVVDYKTRRSGRWKKPLSRQAMEGSSHQIPFYAELTARALGDGWHFDGGELLFIEADDDERSSALTPDDWTKARAPFLAGVSRRVEAMSDGIFPIRPEDGERGHCSWCDFPTLCRKSHGPSRARAARALGNGFTG